jgi:hypothetical protein
MPSDIHIIRGKGPIDLDTTTMNNLAINDPAPATLRALLTGSIDYAGLFPPSGISMPEAVINYATYRNSNYAWMLGRFVCSTSRLDEFIESAGDFISRDAGRRWRIAAVAGKDVFDSIRRVDDFNAHNGPGSVCDVIEIPSASPADIERAMDAMPHGVTAYFELPLDESLADMVAELAIRGLRAKIRTGGVTADAFPRSTAIVRFVLACTAAGVPFKATAGLHHPIRCFSPLTYEADAPQGTMHGFLNLFVMAGFARESYRRNLLEEVMEEEFDEVFSFTDAEFTWRGDYRLTLRQIELLRERGIQSFGSCSFDEPVADLQKLGVL